MIIICAACGKHYKAKTIRSRYCSPECQHRARYKQTNEEIREENEKLKLDIIKWNKKGKTDKEIAKKIGKSSAWVQKRRVEMGIPRVGIKKAQEKEKHKQELAQIEFRFCNRCGSFFYPIRVNQVFCSKECQRYYHNQINDIKRKRLLNPKADDISLDDVYRKYNGICYLCGETCDFNDFEWVNGHKNVHGNYPSREHIVPLSKGGSHTWDNIQLAHIRCNSSKGARYV